MNLCVKAITFYEQPINAYSKPLKPFVQLIKSYVKAYNFLYTTYTLLELSAGPIFVAQSHGPVYHCSLSSAPCQHSQRRMASFQFLNNAGSSSEEELSGEIQQQTPTHSSTTFETLDIRSAHKAASEAAAMVIKKRPALLSSDLTVPCPVVLSASSSQNDPVFHTPPAKHARSPMKTTPSKPSLDEKPKAGKHDKPLVNKKPAAAAKTKGKTEAEAETEATPEAEAITEAEGSCLLSVPCAMSMVSLSQVKPKRDSATFASRLKPRKENTAAFWESLKNMHPVAKSVITQMDFWTFMKKEFDQAPDKSTWNAQMEAAKEEFYKIFKIRLPDCESTLSSKASLAASAVVAHTASDE